jgi:hypothetical protein
MPPSRLRPSAPTARVIPARPQRTGARAWHHAQAKPSLHECIRVLYENSLVPVREIARLSGITERNIYAIVRRLGCRPRLRIGPGGGRRIALPGDAADPPPALDANAAQRAIEACARVRQQLHAGAAATAEAAHRSAAARLSNRAAEADARTLSIMVGVLRDLAAIGGASEAAARKPDDGADAMRRELARRIETMVRDRAALSPQPPPAPMPAQSAPPPAPHVDEPLSEQDRRINAIAARFYAQKH